MATTIAMRVEADARIGAHAAAHERRVNDFVGGAKEAGLLRLIKGLTSRNLRHLAEIFDAADHDRDTALNFREFRLALALLIDATDAHDAEALAPPPLREARVLKFECRRHRQNLPARQARARESDDRAVLSAPPSPCTSCVI